MRVLCWLIGHKWVYTHYVHDKHYRPTGYLQICTRCNKEREVIG